MSLETLYLAFLVSLATCYLTLIPVAYGQLWELWVVPVLERLADNMVALGEAYNCEEAYQKERLLDILTVDLDDLDTEDTGYPGCHVTALVARYRQETSDRIDQAILEAMEGWE